MTTQLVLTPQRRIHLLHRLLLHGWQDVSRDIHRDADFRVPQQFLHDFWVDSQREKRGCRSVPQIVKPNSGLSCFLLERN